MGPINLPAVGGLAAVVVVFGFGLSIHRASAVQKQPVAKAAPTKFVVETPLKAVVNEKSSAATENPHVEPGLVHWHPTFEAACGAARTSGKPVFLFQMMGKLDDRFC
jgi:hypothetical protein